MSNGSILGRFDELSSAAPAVHHPRCRGKQPKGENQMKIRTVFRVKALSANRALTLSRFAPGGRGGALGPGQAYDSVRVKVRLARPCWCRSGVGLRADPDYWAVTYSPRRTSFRSMSSPRRSRLPCHQSGRFVESVVADGWSSESGRRSRRACWSSQAGSTVDRSCYFCDLLPMTWGPL